MRSTGPRRTNRAEATVPLAIARACCRAATALCVALVLVAVASTAAGADNSESDLVDACAAPVIDGTGLLDEELVESRAVAVDGVTVLVRAFDTVLDGDLPTAIDDIVATCLEREGDTWDDDVAIISFSVQDRASDVFYGPQVSPRSDPSAVRESMSDQLAAGDFTGGVLTAIENLAEDIGADAPSAGSDDQPSEGSVSGDPAGAADDPAGTDGSLLPLVGLVAAIGAVGGGSAYVWRRRRLNEIRRSFEAELAAPRSRVAAVREQGLRAEADADLWAKVSAGTTVTVLHEKRNRVRDTGKATEGAASLLGAATHEGIERASAGQIDDARRRLIDLTTALDDNELALAELLAFGAHIDHLRVSLPAKRNLLLQELHAAETLAEKRRREGWKVEEAVGELSRVGAMIQPLEFYELALDHLSLSERIEAAEAKLFAADHDLQSMPDRPGSLGTWRDAQAAAVATEGTRSHTVESRMRALHAEHGRESWAWAEAHPERARQLLADTLTIAAKVEPLIESQQFEEAGRILDEAGMSLIEADVLLDEIDDLVVDLEQAKIEAPGILAESRQVLGQFAAFVRNHAGDLDPNLTAQPELLDRTLDGLASELATATPNYLRVAETAEHINRQLDGLMIAAQKQHHDMEALRRQAVREIARAQRNLRRARESLGWELIKSSDARVIERLSMALGQLPTAPLARLEAASTIADEAHVLQERIISRRRRNGNWIVVGGAHRPHGSTWGTPPSSRGGVGGSRSFGGGVGGSRSFGGGVGGSRSFGGGRSSGSW